MQIGDIERLLQKNRLFGSLSQSAINQIARQVTLVSYKLGDVVIRTGKATSAFYIIAAGKARRVDTAAGDKPITLAVLTERDSFGEQSLLSHSLAKSTVRAAGPLTLLKLEAASNSRRNFNFSEPSKYFPA